MPRLADCGPPGYVFFSVGQMAVFADGRIEVYVGPRELGGADDLEDAIVTFISGARESLDIAVQELDSEPIAQAVLDARWRGVDVDLFLEQDYLRSELPRVPVAPTPRAGETAADALRRVQWLEDTSELTENRRILSALLRSDVEVRGDWNPKIFHQKFVLRDYRGGEARPTSALLTGSANFTSTDTHSNLNHVVVFHSSYVCRQYEEEVEQLRRGSFGRGMHGKVPKTYDLAGVPVKVLFAPDHTPELELIKQMLKGAREIAFAIFTFAGSSGIDDAMLALARGGVKLRGVLDPGQASQGWAAPKWLKHPNIRLYVPKREGIFQSLRKVHHKLMVIDERTVIAGSFNYTEPANLYNDENLFILGSTHKEVEGIDVATNPCRQLARHMQAEIDRIIRLSRRWQP
jgi:phosphatidylserine/phosphatidylglycerophosphate/cardiolipin synthase-like enzyme